MITIFPTDSRFDFMRARFFAIPISLALIAVSFATWFSTGVEKYGVDFAGGSEIVLRFAEQPDIAALRGALEKAGLKNAIVQEFVNPGKTLGLTADAANHDVAVKLKAAGKSDNSTRVSEAIKGAVKSEFSVVKDDYVGPIVGEQIRREGLTALFFSMLGILAYVGFRFEMRFAWGGIIALVHDVIITTGIYLLSGRELSTGMLAAILTIIGYSINDTIIVFDRIRENLHSKGKKKITMAEIINKSINQTMSRTILTSGTTLFVTVSLWLFGGGGIADLSFTLSVGILIGTYSSIFIASPVLLLGKKD